MEGLFLLGGGGGDAIMPPYWMIKVADGNEESYKSSKGIGRYTNRTIH